MTGRCKLCGQEAEFVKAHIVPRSFYPERGLLRNGMRVLSTIDRPSKSLIGVYDSQLVCHDCERSFDPYDNYAAKLLLDGIDKFRTVHHGRGGCQ